jgi:hypothetical protein
MGRSWHLAAAAPSALTDYMDSEIDIAAMTSAR